MAETVVDVLTFPFHKQAKKALGFDKPTPPQTPTPPNAPLDDSDPAAVTGASARKRLALINTSSQGVLGNPAVGRRRLTGV